MVDFSDWLAEELKRRNYSDRGFAVLVGVSPAAVRTWRRGSSVPNWEQLPKIAKGLGVDVAYVRDIAGYRVDEAVEHPPAVSALALSEEEEALVEAFRVAGPEGRAALLATARVAMRFAGDSDQRYEEQQPRQRRVAEG